MFATWAATVLLTLASAGPEPRYTLVLESRAAVIHRVSLNGKMLLDQRPLTSTWYIELRDPRPGANELEIAYVAERERGMTAHIEWTIGTPRRLERLATIPLPGTVGKEPAVRRITFEAKDVVAADQRPQVPDEWRLPVLRTLRAYHAALATRDAGRVLGMYDPSARKRAGFSLVEEGTRSMLAQPDFTMEPLREGGLEWRLQDGAVELTRRDGGPVVLSREVTVEQSVTITTPSGPVTSRGPARSQIAPRRLWFVRDGDGWHLGLGAPR
jgi:hypothetical protein